MDALYPNFYSLTSVTSEPLDPRVRRRSLIWCGNNTTMPSTTTTITTTTSINNINTTNNDTTIITSSNNNSSINDSNTSSNVLLPKKFDDCPEKIPLTKNTGLLIRRRSLSHNPLNRNLSLCNPNHQIYMEPNLINSPTLPSPSPLFADKNLSTVYSTLPQTSSPPPLFADKNLSTGHSTLPQTSGISTILLNNPYSIGPLMDNSMKHQMKDGLKMSTITCNTLSPTRNRKLFDHPLHDQMIKGRSDISRGGDYLLNQPYKHPIHDQFGNNQHYYHRNTYSTLAYPINSNARIQSAVSLQSLDQLKSIHVPDQTIESNYSIDNNLITNECSSLKMKKNNNSLQYCLYQVPGNDQQHQRQHQQHQHSSLVQRSDSFTRTSSSTTGLPMNKTNSLFLGKESFNDIISPIQLNSFHPNRIRPIERRRYTQYGISYHHHNNNELDNDTFRLKHQQQQQQQQQYTTLPQVLPRSSPLSKINSNVQDDNKIEQNGMDMDRNRDIPILSNIRRQKPVNSRRAHVVSAFEQSLNNMSQRLQNLSNTTTRKDSELHELRATIDALRNQTELGFFKKPPINQPCELNRSFNKDLLKQQENSCISTSTTTITTTTITTTTITISNTSNHSENEQAYMNSRLTISNASLNDVDNQQLQMDNSVDRVVSTTSGCKSSGSNVKKNGWFRNSLGKAFRKKTTSSSTLSIHSQSDLDCPTSSIQHKSIYHSNTTNTNNSLPPGHPSNLPQSPTMDHKGLHNTTTTTTTINQSHVNSIQSNNHMNVLPILSNTHLNGLSPSNSSTLSSSSSSWSTLGISGNGQNNCNIITATTTTSSSNSSTIIPQTNEQTERLNNARQQQQQQQHQQDHRPIHSNQLSCPNHLINYNKSDKQNTSFNVEERDKNMLDNNDSKLELTKQSCQDELNHLKCQLAEKESKLTDVQLEALASAHQLDQLKDEMSHLYSQLNYLRTDNERLQILVKHLQKQQQYHHHHQQQHQLQHNTTNSSISSRLLLMNNDNVITSTNTTMTLTPTNTNVHCNSLTQSIPSMSLQHKSTGLHNDDNNDISMVFNTEIASVECVTCSDLLIGFSNKTNHFNHSFIATVNLILMNPVNNHSSANSILNIGMIHISTLNHWNTINSSLIHLYYLYYSYLNLNGTHDLERNELKQYQLYMNNQLILTCKLNVNQNRFNYSIEFNNQKIINNNNNDNLENLFNLLQFETKQLKHIQLSINQYHLLIDNDDEQIDLSINNNNNNQQIDLSINNSNIINEPIDLLNNNNHNIDWKNNNFYKNLKNFNQLLIKTLFNRDILYFYYKLLLQYYIIIFYDQDEDCLNKLMEAFYEHIYDTSINSSSLKVYYFNLSDGEQTTMNHLYQCLSQYTNRTMNLSEQIPPHLIIIFYIQSMNQIPYEDYRKIINYFKAYYHENKDDSIRTCSIYLIGTWITSIDISSIGSSSSSSSSLTSVPEPLRNLTSSTNIKMISYPNGIYKPIQCIDELICWIEIDYSFKQTYMIGSLKKQLIHSFINEFNQTLSNCSLNQMNEEYLERFHNQLRFYEDLIKWIQQVLNHLNQFLIELYNHHNEIQLNNEQIHFINPSIFLTLPFTPLPPTPTPLPPPPTTTTTTTTTTTINNNNNNNNNNSNNSNPSMTSELWFIDLWNNKIVKIMQKFINQLSNHHHDHNNKSIKDPINFNDPTDWILSTWPWHSIDWLKYFNKEKQNSKLNLIHLIELYTKK